MRPLTGLLLLSVSLAGCESATDPATAGTAMPLSGSRAVIGSVVFVSLTTTSPIVPGLKQRDCPVAPEGFCGHGQAIPFGIVTDMIEFGAGCGGACDLRTIKLPQGTLVLEETFSDPSCPGFCHPNPAEPLSGTLTDVIVSGTGLFQGATGVLKGRVMAAGLTAGSALVKLSGTITLAT